MRHHSQLLLKIILVLFALIPSMNINAQETEPVIIGEKYKLHSNILNEDR